MKVLTHVKPDIQGSWEPHADLAWYTGPAMHHYRYYRVWAWETCAERIDNTISWFPSTLVMPITSSADQPIA